MIDSVLAEPKQIERIRAPSRREFTRMRRRADVPVVITGVVDAWPAADHWSLPHFRERLGGCTASMIPVRDGVLDINPEHGSRLRQLTWEQALELMAQMPLVAADGIYLVCPLAELPSWVARDIRVPEYCASASWLRSMLFVGVPGVVTPLHQDMPDNLYAQVQGTRRWTLYPPRPGRIMYRNSPFHGAPNHSRCDPENPDFERYPRFREAEAWVTDLRPGELLFLPPLWWHHVRSLDAGPAISVNFWWATGWRLPLARAAAAYKKWRKI